MDLGAMDLTRKTKKGNYKMYENESYKVMVAFDILTDIKGNYKSSFNSSEEMYKEIIGYINEHNKIDNGKNSWYDSLREYLINKNKMKGSINES